MIINREDHLLQLETTDQGGEVIPLKEFLAYFDTLEDKGSDDLMIHIGGGHGGEALLIVYYKD